MGRVPRTVLALALLSAALAAPASAGTWSSLTAPQTNWDQPFRLQYDPAGNAYAITNASGGATSLFVRPAAGGDFAVSGPPIAGTGTTAMSPSDDSGRVHFLGARSGNIKYRRRGLGGNFAPMSESTLGPGVLSPLSLDAALGVNGTSGYVIAAWPADSSGTGALNAQFGAPSMFAFSADALTGSPAVGLLSGLFPFAGAAADSDGSGVIVYSDTSSGDGNLSFVVRDPAGSPNKWGAATAIGDTAASLATFASDLSGDAIVVWQDGSALKSSWHAHDTTTFSSPQTLPSGQLAGFVMQPTGAAVAALLTSNSPNDSVQLYTRAAGAATFWVPLGGAHNVGQNDLVGLAVSRTGDHIVFAWDQKPADTATQPYRIFAQTGTSAGMSPADGDVLPGQPATPGQTGGNHNDQPAVAIDPNGNAVALWDGARSGPPGNVFAAVFDPGGTTPPNNPPDNPPTNNPPTNNPPTNNPPPSPDFPSLLPPGTIKVGNGTLSIPTFCSPSAKDGCNGAIGTVIAGSYNPGGPVFAARIKRFSYKLKNVAFSLKAGGRKTVKIKLTNAAKNAVKAALRHRGGKATVTLQATVNGRKGKRKIVKFKR
jgi:hypothetical protein